MREWAECVYATTSPLTCPWEPKVLPESLVLVIGASPHQLRKGKTSMAKLRGVQKHFSFIFFSQPQRMNELTFYDVLGCGINCTKSQIIAEYRARSLKLHPDKSGPSRPLTLTSSCFALASLSEFSLIIDFYFIHDLGICELLSHEIKSLSSPLTAPLRSSDVLTLLICLFLSIN